MSSKRNWTKYRVKVASRDTVKDLFYRIRMEEVGRSTEKPSLSKLLGVDADTLKSFQNETGISESAYQKIARSIRNFRPDFEISEHAEPFHTNAARNTIDTPQSGVLTSQLKDSGDVDEVHNPNASSLYFRLLFPAAIVIVLVSLGYIVIHNQPSSEQGEEAKSSSASSDSTSSVVILGTNSDAVPIQKTENPLPYSWRQQELELDIDWDIRVARGEDILGLDELEEPLIAGDLLKIKVYSKRPVYFRVFWLDSEGAVFRIYPESNSQYGLNTTLELPTTPDQSFILSSVEGLHALVTVALQTDVSHDAMPMPLPQPTNIIPFEQGAAFFDETGMVDRGKRGPPIAFSRTANVNDPVGVLSAITKSKWDQRAAAVRAVCFVIMNRTKRE